MSQGKNAGSVSNAPISAALVKELREKTGAGMMECRKALVEAKGDLEKSVSILRQRGILSAEKKKDRAATEGRIESYIHFGGKIGTLIEVNCETDFVAKTQDFQDLCKSLSMQIAASNPKWVSRDQVPKDMIEEERKIHEAAANKDGKPADIVNKIVDGRMDKFFQANCLLEQPFIKEPDHSVSAIIKEAIAKMGENIIIKRFTRFALGEEK